MWIKEAAESIQNKAAMNYDKLLVKKKYPRTIT